MTVSLSVINTILGYSEEEAAEIVKCAPHFDKGFNRGIDEGFNAGWFAALDAVILAASDKNEDKARKIVAKAANRRETLCAVHCGKLKRPYTK
jgi:hypothetical protein